MHKPICDKYPTVERVFNVWHIQFNDISATSAEVIYYISGQKIEYC